MSFNFPSIGLGTYKMNESNLSYIIPISLDLGYYIFDTAISYNNEKYLYEILENELNKRNLKRSNIFIITKLKPINHGYNNTIKSIQQSAILLGGYIDLFLIHWPGVSKLSPNDERNLQLRTESWNAMQDMLDEGIYLRNIGVSNYTISHLKQMKEHITYRIPPMINQYELHPGYHPQELIDYCQENNIHLQSYSTLGTGQLLDESFIQQYPFLEDMIMKYTIILKQLIEQHNYQSYFLPSSLSSSSNNDNNDNSNNNDNSIIISRQCVLACIYLKWALQSSFSVIPKSLNPSHICANMLSKYLELTENEMNQINSIQSDNPTKICWNPEVVR